MSKIDSILHTAAKKYPDVIAIEGSLHQMTYSNLLMHVEHCYNDIIKKIPISTKVALSVTNNTATIIVLFALLYNRNLVALISPDEPIVPTTKKINQFNTSHTIGFVTNDSLSTDQLLSSTKSDNKLPSTLDLTRPATMIFTSGSSGNPKGVIHTLGNHYYSALGSNENMILKPTDRYLLSLPLHHISGLAILFRCFLSGATVVIDNTESALPDKIKSHNVTHLSIVPTQLINLLESPTEKINSLKAVLLGGSAVSPSLIQKAIDKKIPLLTTYGMSETSSQLTTTSPDDPPEKLFTSGKLLNYRKLKIADDGEITVGGEVLFHSYLAGEKNIAGGYFATGDIGHLDKDGYLTITGRKDNMFISGGENIHPEPLEGMLMFLDEIDDALVVPITDKKFGHRPGVFIKWSDNNHKLTLDDINKQLLKVHPPFCKIIKLFEWPDNIKSGLKLNRSDFSKLIEK